jgi:hypothetical protein
MRLALGLTACALILSACQIDLIFDVVLNDDGSGTVDFTMRADDEVMAHVDVDRIDLTGLATNSWELGGPVVDEEGGAAIVLSTNVGSAEQFDEVVAQIDMGRLLGEVAVEVVAGLGSTTYDVNITINPTMVATDFSDSGLVELLDGEPFGEQIAVLEERAGATLDESVLVTVNLTMPDGVLSGATVDLAGDEPAFVTGHTSFVDDTLDERRAAALDAKDTFDDSIRLVGVFWALAAVVAFVLLSLGWRRRRLVFRQLR